jgi:hypothetical protein
MATKEKNRPAQAEKPQVVLSVKQRPIHEVKMPFNGGLLTAAIWRHQKDQGHPWFSVSLSRAHVDATGKWSYGENSFSRDELLGLVRVIEVAHRHIVAGNFSGGTDNE